MKNIQQAYAQRLRPGPFLVGTLGGSRRPQVVGNFTRNSSSFQFRAARVQYRFRTSEMTQQRVGGSKAEASDKRHAQHGKRPTCIVRNSIHGRGLVHVACRV